jgi:hypothetical protein
LTKRRNLPKRRKELDFFSGTGIRWGEMKKAFLVRSLKYWGRGETIKEAALQCRSEGAELGDPVVVKLVLGDEFPTMTGTGEIFTEKKCEVVDIGSGWDLGHFLKKGA